MSDPETLHFKFPVAPASKDQKLFQVKYWHFKFPVAPASKDQKLFQVESLISFSAAVTRLHPAVISPV